MLSLFFNSGPRDPLRCMFSMFPSSATPYWNDQLVIKLCSGLIRSHTFESGVLEEGNIENMQGSGSRGPELKIAKQTKKNTMWKHFSLLLAFTCYRGINYPNFDPRQMLSCMASTTVSSCAGLLHEHNKHSYHWYMLIYNICLFNVCELWP